MVTVASALNTRNIHDHVSAVAYFRARRVELIDAAEATVDLAEKMRLNRDFDAARELVAEAQEILQMARSITPLSPLSVFI